MDISAPAYRFGFKPVEIADIKLNDRACFSIPERGGISLGFGRVLKINKKTILIRDEKFTGETQMLVDKALVYKVLREE